MGTFLIYWACCGLGSVTIFFFKTLVQIVFWAFFFFFFLLESRANNFYFLFFNLRVFLIIKYKSFFFLRLFSGQGVPGNTLSCTWHRHWLRM